MLAMPETLIGLFPDVGSSWFLPKLGSLGECLDVRFTEAGFGFGWWMSSFGGGRRGMGGGCVCVCVCCVFQRRLLTLRGMSLCRSE
jgi:hypothetical protein